MLYKGVIILKGVENSSFIDTFCHILSPLAGMPDLWDIKHLEI